MTTTAKKTCLIISYGPVPTPQYQTVEGGGMRAWGLADGLKSHGIDVTIGINASFPQRLSEHDGIKLATWNLDADFVKLMNSFDSVIISYNMGDPSVFVADNISDDVQLILDAYVPIYIEVSARESKDINTEYVNYMADIARHNKVLSRGDYFLYANDAQELMYNGVLSALGVINPHSYRDKRLIKTPFGIHRTPLDNSVNPYKELGIGSKDFVVLWFGGLYPWFRIEEYLEAIKQCSEIPNMKFVFVGGRNPFNPNPDFFRQYDLAVDFAKKNKFTNRTMFFVDWVDFNERVNWFTHANVIVSLNQTGEENKYSWRTRVMDFVWGEAVTISNGGDPLSEELIAKDAAIRLPELSAKALVEVIKKAKSDSSLISTAKKSLRKIKESYYWDVVTTELSETVKLHSLPFVAEQSLRAMVETEKGPTANLSGFSDGTLRKALMMPRKVARKIKQKGVKRTIRLAGSVVKTHLKSRASVGPRQRQFVFISHPIDNTGGPGVLLQMVEEYVNKYGASRVRVIAPGAEPDQELFLKKLGITVEQAVFGIGFRFIRLQLNLHPDDFVLMNTTAVYDTYRDFILLWLKLGRLKHAYWFIHEDLEQIPIIHKEFLDPRNLRQTKELVDNKSLSLLFPSIRTSEEYKELLQIDRAKSIKLHVEVDEKYTKPRVSSDFSSIGFLLSGTATDGRKGQFLALSAFYRFMKEYYDKNPSNYRNFTLHLVAINNDYVSRQIRWVAKSLMSNHVKIYESLPKADALKITANCNAVVCCSLNETFGLYIAEGMLMGHVVLRNNSAGVDEQLHDGKNGYFIDHTNVSQFSEQIERTLNKSTNTNDDLLAMSRRSQDIMRSYSNFKYINQIEE